MPTVIEAVKSLERRTPWSVAQKILKSLGLPRGMGWKRTLAKIEADDSGLEAFEDEIENALKEQIWCGEKLVRFYEVEESIKRRLLRAIRDLEIPNRRRRNPYPILLSNDQIEEIHPSSHHVIAVEERDEDVGVIFSSTKAILLRTEIDADDFPDEMQDYLADYDQLVGVKSVKFQAFDSIWVPRNGNTIESRVDFPAGMTHDQGLQGHELVRSALSDLTGFDALSQPVNLYPLLKRMYDRAAEGNVVEIAFGTTTASLKQEKMRRRQLCLRQETYHNGGKNALTEPIRPFRISIEWYREITEDVTSRPELALRSNSRMAANPRPTLFDAAIRNCVSSEDYEYVCSRIRAHIR